VRGDREKTKPKGRPESTKAKKQLKENKTNDSIIKTMDKLCACTADIIIDVVVMAIGCVAITAAAADRAMNGSSSACDRVGQLALPVLRAMLLPQCPRNALYPPICRRLALNDKEARLGRLSMCLSHINSPLDINQKAKDKKKDAQ
jgi:hypothetical protein